MNALFFSPIATSNMLVLGPAARERSVLESASRSLRCNDFSAGSLLIRESALNPTSLWLQAAGSRQRLGLGAASAVPKGDGNRE